MKLDKQTPDLRADAIQLLSRSALWAIQPEALAAIFSHGPATVEPSKPTAPDKIAVIPIRGVLTNDDPARYGSNYQTIADSAEKAAADPKVSRIVLAVDSPGGEVTGLPEAAAVLARVAKVKPVSAIVEGTAASAAYWLTSQAHDITLTPSGEVGSVGIRMMHVDTSKMLAKEGYKVTELHSGKFKTEWSPYKPLSDEAKADMQTRIDANYKQFLDAVASGRGRRLSAAATQSQYGGGRMLSAPDALKAGLVDKLQATREFYRGLSKAGPALMGTTSVGIARRELARRRLDILKG